ncbi:hypothetical protein WMY93_026096 [Mugilogobius chulae]|uniref:NADP-dependent malic enzyme n=1 Tax=Mugilogobius chulae TaxID=88201 RepID=A0AAW0N8C5_9GOBI
MKLLSTKTYGIGMAFSLEERQQLGIHGLLPPCFISQDVQLLRVLKNYDMKRDDLDRYVFLMGLQDRSEKLFYHVLTSDIERFMPVIYTPTVGLACQQYGLIFRRPRGLFITVHDRGHIASILQNWPEKDIKAVCVTDGERILGLGDLGCYGMGIPVGKLALYTTCGGMPPQQCLPVMLDVGTDNETLLKDPLYIGLRHRRVRGQVYDDLLDEFMKAVSDRYGMDCLIQFEDFANINAFRLLSKYRNKYCTFNDDIQGRGHLTHEKERFAHEHPQMNRLEDVVREIKPTAIIGVAAVPGAFSEQIIKDMSSFNKSPIIFALATPQVKLSAQLNSVTRSLRYKSNLSVIFLYLFVSETLSSYTIQGRGIFASGSPFDPVTMPDGKTLFPGQGNNAYIFPGVGLGVTACGIRHVTEEIFLTAAETLAEQVTEKDLTEGRLYPPLSSIQGVSLKLAAKIMEFAFKHNMATLHPEPSDKQEYLKSLVYNTDYEEFVVDSYRWPRTA